MLSDNNFNSFSMRKIPVYNKPDENFDDINLDKIKILELSNSVDKWEKEILFAENGFYSIKGADVKNKLSDFEKELEDFINIQISQISFSDVNMKDIALEIRDNKLNAIKHEMKLYENEQLKQWKTQVFEDAISYTISRAILYKSKEDIVQKSFNNGIQVIIAMADSENWNAKVKENKIKTFKSRFFTDLIKAFIESKDIKAAVFFNKYKDFLDEEVKREVEFAIKELKINVIAYNFAKELFSYKLSDKEQEKEICTIKDKNVENAVRNYISDFKLFEKQEKELEKQEKNSDNWQTIINLEEFDKALLYIDYSLDENSIKCKKDYIQKIKKEGFIKTDKSLFLKLLSEVFSDFNGFKHKDLSNYYQGLSPEDFELMKNYQKLDDKKFIFFESDYKFLLKNLKKLNLSSDEDKYAFIKLAISSIDLYKSVNKKEVDFEAKNKIFEALCERFKQDNTKEISASHNTNNSSEGNKKKE